jgi:ABC-type amino acid transport substrate-binding protein
MPLKILPHGRLQEWVAEEQGYFAAEGLEYTFLPEGDYGVPVGQVSTGAFETFGAGRGGAGISCACHWATNTAAGQRASRLVTTAYSVAPCAVMVPPESPVRGPADLAGVPVGVGYHSLRDSQGWSRQIPRFSVRFYRPPTTFPRTSTPHRQIGTNG